MDAKTLYSPYPDDRRSARQRLIGAANRGGITLVLGAGISVPRGIPNWEDLARAVWKSALPAERSPWENSPPGQSPTEVPQFLPIVFELACRAAGPDAFLQLLKKRMYARCRYPNGDNSFPRSSESLAVLARALVQEQKRAARRRIDAVITLNADDLLEQAVNRVAGIETPRPHQEIVRVVARSTHSILGRRLERQPIPVYHVHGFVPSNHISRYGSYFDHMLVFTDTQYWAVSASAGSFANRIVTSALSEGICVFIGLSMTDINLLRWLAVRHWEMDQDLASVSSVPKSPVGMQRQFMFYGFSRHFWIRPKSDDPSGFLSQFLALRGISSVEIGAWQGRSFRKLIEACFPPPKDS